MRGSSKEHLYSLDFLKFIAAIFITNSHSQPLYEGANTAFAWLCVLWLLKVWYIVC